MVVMFLCRTLYKIHVTSARLYTSVCGSRVLDLLLKTVMLILKKKHALLQKKCEKIENA